MIYKNLTRKFISDILVSGFSDGGLKIVLANSDTWNVPLPENVKTHPTIILDIKGWSLEESFVDDEGIFIQTAFGEIEYSRHFSFEEVLQIMTFDGRVIFVKTLQLETPKVSTETAPTPKPSVIMKIENKIPMKSDDDEGVKYSLQKMLEMNSHLDKYKKGL